MVITDKIIKTYIVAAKQRLRKRPTHRIIGVFRLRQHKIALAELGPDRFHTGLTPGLILFKLQCPLPVH